MKKFVIFLFFVGMFFSSNISFGQNKSYLNNRIIFEGVYKRNLGNFSEVWSSAAGGYIGYGIAFPEYRKFDVLFVFHEARNVSIGGSSPTAGWARTFGISRKAGA